MARSARLVIPDHPHHVIQRGARCMKIFFKGDGYKTYLDLLREWSGKAGTVVWGYCLMPTHIHLILTPSHEDGLRAALGETHRRYARLINDRKGWRGHPLGSDGYYKKLQKMLGRDVRPRPRDRPKAAC